MKKRIFVCITSIVLLLSGCSNSLHKINDYSSLAFDNINTTIKSEDDSTVNLVSVGDNLINEPIYNEAHAASDDGTYNFDYPYQYIGDYIKGADIAVLNQETPIA